MELQQLITFRTVAAIGSFSKAAEVLGYAQSTVSEHIKSLEAELKILLFKRAGSKRIALTHAGELLLKYGQKMLNLEAEIKSEVVGQAGEQGTLSIRIPETVSIHFLPPLLQRFRKRFPKANLGFMNCVYFDLPEELSAGIVDLGFLITDDFQAPGLETERLCPIPLALVTYPGHPFAQGARIELSRLKTEPLIVPANDCSYVQMLDRILTERKIHLPQVWRFSSIEAIKQAVKSGIGAAILPEIAVRRELKEGSLVALPWQEKKIAANLIMIWQKNKWLPPLLRAFMEMVREDLASPRSRAD
jgi:DNA-binding transcriptional LysR family regulator